MRYISSLFACFFIAVAAPAALQAQTPTFSSAQQVLADSTYLYLFGNFNGNGNTDLIVDGLTFTNEFLTGDGNGNFSDTGPVSALPAQNVSLVADVNGDGKDDIITLLPGCEEKPCGINPDEGDADGIITVMLSQGNGKFTRGYVGTLPAGLGAVLGVVGDFNKDGKPDIAVLAFENGNSYYSATAELCIFLNSGNGSFVQTDYDLPESLASGNPELANLVTGDFEGNGNQDIAFVVESAQGTPIAYPEIFTVAGNGKGDFGPAVVSYTFDSGVYEFSLFAADLNADGRTDLLTSLLAKAPNQATGNIRLPSLLANTSGRFYWGSAVYVAPGSDGISYLLDDFNGDGKPDLFTITTTDNSNQSGQAGIYLGLGNGTFKTPHIPLNLQPTPLVTTMTPVPLKSGALPSLIVEIDNDPSRLELFINTTKK